jgi:hypothetical protein
VLALNDCGAIEYIEKPFNYQQIHWKVYNILGLAPKMEKADQPEVPAVSLPGTSKANRDVDLRNTDVEIRIEFDEPQPPRSDDEFYPGPAIKMSKNMNPTMDARTKFSSDRNPADRMARVIESEIAQKFDNFLSELGIPRI